MDFLLWLVIGVWAVLTMVLIIVVACLLDDRKAMRERAERESCSICQGWYRDPFAAPSDYPYVRLNRDKDSK